MTRRPVESHPEAFNGRFWTRRRRRTVGALAGLVAATGGVGVAVAAPARHAPRPAESYSASRTPGGTTPSQDPSRPTNLDVQREQEPQPLAKVQADKLAAQLNQSRGQGSFHVRMFAGTISRPTPDGRQEYISHPLVFGDPSDTALAHKWFGVQVTHDGKLSFSLIAYDDDPKDNIAYVEDPQAQASGNPFMGADVYLDNGAGRNVPPEQLPQMWATDAQGTSFVVMPASSHVSN